MTVEFCRQFSSQILVKTFLLVMEGMGNEGYRFFSQLEENFIRVCKNLSQYPRIIYIHWQNKQNCHCCVLGSYEASLQL